MDAIRPEMLDRFFGGEDRPEHVDVELTMELILGDVFQREEFVDAGMVHQHVDRAEGFFGFVKQPLHVGGLGDVALDGDGGLLLLDISGAALLVCEVLPDAYHL